MQSNSMNIKLLEASPKEKSTKIESPRCVERTRSRFFGAVREYFSDLPGAEQFVKALLIFGVVDIGNWKGFGWRVRQVFTAQRILTSWFLKPAGKEGDAKKQNPSAGVGKSSWKRPNFHKNPIEFEIRAIEIKAPQNRHLRHLTGQLTAADGHNFPQPGHFQQTALWGNFYAAAPFLQPFGTWIA
ncbi:hypothetical protein TNCV_494521 [Trichonephila clavipes]|nr:hypothetical protein TNCV_494521 [Trichonephila clavipes]